MGRGGRVSVKRNFKKLVRSKRMGSDDSDEDYVVSNEEIVVSSYSEDDCASLDRYASEEDCFGSYVEEEEEVKKIIRSRARKGNLSQRKNGVKEPKRRRKRTLYDEEEDRDYDDKDNKEAEEEEFTGPRKRKRAYYNEGEGYEDYVDDDEFTPGAEEDDCLYDEEELIVRKRTNKKKVGRWGLQKKRSVRGWKRRKLMVTKKPSGKKGRKKSGLRRKARFHDGDVDFVDENPIVREKCMTILENVVQRKRKYVAQSDSDFVSSGSSDFEYTISEEEREQVREASELCRSLTTGLRSSKRIQEDEDMSQPRKSSVKRGKEKLEEVNKIKSEVGKQVCGICLSEEDKRNVRGKLNCCSHYFCFTCIMEWSKVESRCPLCKQRFKTIGKPARMNLGIDLRDVEILVPERDQVYQPSEEEIRGYLDPYENVICSECHQGGDDGLILLCDLCDSSAHTYCVGLGWEVPEGNWYCDGCRPLGSSSSQAQEHLSDQRRTGNYLSNRPMSDINVREELDLNSVPSPHTPSTQQFGILSSPRFPLGDAQAASTVSGVGGPTLSGRRWIHRQIRNFLSARMSFMAGGNDGISAANSNGEIFNSPNDQDMETAFQHTRTQDRGTLHHTFLEQRLQDNPSPLVQNRDLLSRLSHSTEPVQDPSTTTTDRFVNETVWPELPRSNLVSGHEHLHQCSSRSNIGSDRSVFPFTVREESHFYAAKEQVQSMVKSYLRSLSSDIELGHSTFKGIARQSTHTILAACGLEHRRSQVCCVPPPPACSHVERAATGSTSLMKGFCSSCFDSFVRDVVQTALNTRLSPSLIGSRV